MQQQRFLMPDFWRSVASVLSGTALAQSLPILGSLVIAREYIPADFGAYAAWLGVVAIAAVVVTGRFETSFAIVLDGEPRRLAVVCTLITLCLSTAALAVICVILLVAAPAMLGNVNSFLVILFTPAVLLVASTQVWQTWAATEGLYRKLSIMRICQAGSIVALQIVAGAVFSSAVALALSYTVGLLIGLCVNFRFMPLGPLPNDTTGVLRQFWSRYARFPAYSLPADGINTLSGQLPILVIASRFGPEVAGFLALTMRTLGAPIALLGKSVLDVFKRQAAVSYRARGECRADYLQTFWVLAAGALLVSIILLFSSNSLFALAFGEKWRMAGTMAVWLLPMFAMAFIASPLSYMVYIVEKQHVDLFWQICLLLMTVVTLNLPTGYPAVLQSYSAGYAALYVAYLMMSYNFSLGKRPLIAIIDYDIGNLAAVANMLHRVSVQSRITGDPDIIATADKIILPGNGAFDACMCGLRATGLVELLERRVLVDKVPLLGICVGAQMLANQSEEGEEPGLGWLDMRVQRFENRPGLPVPHMGWNQVTPVQMSHPLTRDLEDARFYFVHSYYLAPQDPADILLTANYGIDFAAGVARDNIMGVQFHPEKSHRFGKALLRAFAEAS